MLNMDAKYDVQPICQNVVCLFGPKGSLSTVNKNKTMCESSEKYSIEVIKIFV